MRQYGPIVYSGPFQQYRISQSAESYVSNTHNVELR